MYLNEQQAFIQYLVEDVVEYAPTPPGSGEKIYVVITDTKTLFSKMTSLITKQKYNHISISFDKSLKELYSFDLHTNAIQKETPEIFNPNTEFIAYSMEVAPEVKAKMSERVQHIFAHKDSFFYSKVILVKAAVNRLLGREYFNLDELTRTEFICSTFVLDLLNITNVKFFKPGYIPAPSDFKSHKMLKYEFRGTFKNYWAKQSA